MATRFSLVLAAALLAGCGGGADGTSGSSGDWDTGTESQSPGVAMKISYLSFQPQTDAKGHTTGWKHAWKYMLSQGWMNKRGPSPREPFERLWRRDAFVGENIHDARFAAMIEELKAAGLAELRETPVNQIDLDKLKSIELTGNRDAASRTRIITVETEEFRRTVVSYENSAPGLVEKFRAVERVVIKCVFANTIQVTKESHSTMPRGKN